MSVKRRLRENYRFLCYEFLAVGFLGAMMLIFLDNSPEHYIAKITWWLALAHCLFWIIMVSLSLLRGMGIKGFSIQEIRELVRVVIIMTILNGGMLVKASSLKYSILSPWWTVLVFGVLLGWLGVLRLYFFRIIESHILEELIKEAKLH